MLKLDYVGILLYYYYYLGKDYVDDHLVHHSWVHHGPDVPHQLLLPSPVELSFRNDTKPQGEPTFQVLQ